jgi:phosphoinositide 3-/4-kinase-like protein
MLGHILGIGDRHLDNILLHTESAEVVQIDYAVVCTAHTATLHKPKLQHCTDKLLDAHTLLHTRF